MGNARNVGKCVTCDGRVEAHAAIWTPDFTVFKRDGLSPRYLTHRGHCTDVLKSRLADAARAKGKG